MINELYMLSEAINRAEIKTDIWHRKYKPLPNITAKSHCYRITIADGKVLEISSVGKELGSILRKYGTNQGTFPGMNLAPLYRITDETVKGALSELRPEDINPTKLLEIRSWCTENNWKNKLQNKYRISMKNVPEELLALVPGFSPLQILVKESSFFLDPAVLYRELENVAFAMLSERRNVSEALEILFHLGNSGKSAEDDFGDISVVFESPRLIEMGIPAVSGKFVDGLNAALLSADVTDSFDDNLNDVDAFGIPFHFVDEPMPEVKLAGGFDVKLRTMFKAQHCQMRYGRIESAGYPISTGVRKTLQSSLNWLGSVEQKGKTWISTDKNEIMFAYPSQLPKTSVSYVNAFSFVGGEEEADTSSLSESLFIERAKSLVSDLEHGKEAGTDSNADHLQIFILRKIDKARTKVVYTRQTDAQELEILCEEWSTGCRNLPLFSFGQPSVLFPLSAADVLNRFWKQNGEQATTKFKPIPRYHGVELLLESEMSISSDLHALAKQTVALGGYIGNQSTCRDLSEQMHKNVLNLLALAGLLLYRVGIRKETYMENLPYLFGQLLKVSDELHALYCTVVRNGDLPTQLAGSSVYQAAVEAPIRTLNLLGTRMNPYITWAKSYRTKEITESKKESRRAGWLLSLYESIASKLYEVWQPEIRFGDAEKAQFFIGYLAAFPKSMRSSEKNSGADAGNNKGGN